MLGMLDDIINNPTSAKTAEFYAQSFQYRNTSLNNFMAEYDLQIKSDLNSRVLVEKYLSKRA
jgi:hypothetical protein